MNQLLRTHLNFPTLLPRQQLHKQLQQLPVPVLVGKSLSDYFYHATLVQRIALDVLDYLDQRRNVIRLDFEGVQKIVKSLGILPIFEVNIAQKVVNRICTEILPQVSLTQVLSLPGTLGLHVARSQQKYSLLDGFLLSRLKHLESAISLILKQNMTQQRNRPPDLRTLLRTRIGQFYLTMHRRPHIVVMLIVLYRVTVVTQQDESFPHSVQSIQLTQFVHLQADVDNLTVLELVEIKDREVLQDRYLQLCVFGCLLEQR